MASERRTLPSANPAKAAPRRGRGDEASAVRKQGYEERGLESAAVHPIVSGDRHAGVIRAVADLLSRLRLDFVFVGSVARAAHLGHPIGGGSIDAIATMGPQQKNQLAMMAKNNGFLVEREEIEAAEELDLVPMRFDDTRVHVLVASNALYGRMVAEGVQAQLGDVTLKVPRIEDFALLLQMNSDVESLMSVIECPQFDRASYNAKLLAIGLRDFIVPQAEDKP